MKATLLALAVVATLAACASPADVTTASKDAGNCNAAQRCTTVTTNKDRVALRDEMDRRRDQDVLRASAMRASNR